MSAPAGDLGLGGSNDGIINISQVPSACLSLGSALTEQVPNPFFGLPAGQGKSVTERDDSASRTAASVPPVQQHPDAPEPTPAKASTTPPCSSSRSA